MINELNRECEELEVGNRTLSNEIVRSKGQGASSDIHRQAIFKSIEDRIVGADRREAANTLKTQELLTVVGQMKTVVRRVFYQMGCSGAMAHQLTMDGVTDSNIMQVSVFLDESSHTCFFEGVFGGVRRNIVLSDTAGHK